jgi:hypothetical protein
VLTQLNPPIPLDTSRGPGIALAVIDYGMEHNLLWVVGLDESGEMWCVPNSEVRLQPNWSAGRRGDRYDPRRQAAGPPQEAGAG